MCLFLLFIMGLNLHIYYWPIRVFHVFAAVGLLPAMRLGQASPVGTTVHTLYICVYLYSLVYIYMHMCACVYIVYAFAYLHTFA